MNLDILRFRFRFKINYNKVVHNGLSNQSIREIISKKVKSDAMFWSTLSDFYSPEFIVLNWDQVEGCLANNSLLNRVIKISFLLRGFLEILCGFEEKSLPKYPSYIFLKSFL